MLCLFKLFVLLLVSIGPDGDQLRYRFMMFVNFKFNLYLTYSIIFVTFEANVFALIRYCLQLPFSTRHADII